MSGKIFVSYRRDDAKHPTGRLVDRLGKTFTGDQIFIDVDNIAPGLDFRQVLADKVQACDVLLAVIGQGWLGSRNAKGDRRLDDPRDFVRIEIESALSRNVRVIPILVDGADMPTEDDLPESLRPLAYRNAVRLSYERFGIDADQLTKALADIVAPAAWHDAGPRAQSAPTPAVVAEPPRTPLRATPTAVGEPELGLPWSVFSMPLISAALMGVVIAPELRGTGLGPDGFFKLASTIGVVWFIWTALVIWSKRRSIDGADWVSYWIASLPWSFSMSLVIGNHDALSACIGFVISGAAALVLWRLMRSWQRRAALTA